MGFISEMFDTESPTSVAFYSKAATFVKGVEQPGSYTLVDTINCLFWTSGKAVTFFSDKLKTQVDAVVALDYDATIAALKDNGRIKAKDLYYQILDVENPGEQNETLEVPVKRESSNG